MIRPERHLRMIRLRDLVMTDGFTVRTCIAKSQLCSQKDVSSRLHSRLASTNSNEASTNNISARNLKKVGQGRLSALKKMLLGSYAGSDNDPKGHLCTAATVEAGLKADGETIIAEPNGIRALVREEVREQLSNQSQQGNTNITRPSSNMSGTGALEKHSRPLSEDELGLQNAVLVSGAVKTKFPGRLPELALLGRTVPRTTDNILQRSQGIWLNTSHPSSILVFGAQGSGKSHSLSCLLENFLIPDSSIGTMKHPSTGLVLSYSSMSSPSAFRPSEAAWLSTRKNSSDGGFVPATVLASPTNLYHLKRAYSRFPNITVKPFLLPPHQLTSTALLTLMGVTSFANLANPPLYIIQVQKLIREMTKYSINFDYGEFRKRIADLQLNSMQLSLLMQRVENMEQFLDLNEEVEGGSFSFQDGTITIIDLSSPMDDKETALHLFNIAVETFLGLGKRNCVVAIDEAHKYLGGSGASGTLTETLCRHIRERRHLGSRIIISTQDPTMSPKMLELASMVMIHKFDSPRWFEALKRNIPLGEESAKSSQIFELITKLQTGEALCFATSAKIGALKIGSGASCLVKVKIRDRLTLDGGQSVLSNDLK